MRYSVQLIISARTTFFFMAKDREELTVLLSMAKMYSQTLQASINFVSVDVWTGVKVESTVNYVNS
jgi:hypothetical protein